MVRTSVELMCKKIISMLCSKSFLTWIDDIEMRPSQGGGGYLFPCTPEINWPVPLFPKN